MAVNKYAEGDCHLPIQKSEIKDLGNYQLKFVANFAGKEVPVNIQTDTTNYTQLNQIQRVT